MPRLERLEERTLMVGEVAAYRFVLTDNNGAALSDAATVSVGQTVKLNVNVQDVRPDSEFAALIADAQAHGQTLTANELKGFLQAFIDVDFNPNFVQSTVTNPDNLVFGEDFNPSPNVVETPWSRDPNDDFGISGTISNVQGKFNDVGTLAANFGDTPLQNGNQMLFFTAPFTVTHAPLNGQPDPNASTAQNTGVEIAVLANDTVGGTVQFLGSPAELTNAFRGQVWMILRGGDDPNTNRDPFPLTSAAQLSFQNDSLNISGIKRIKANSFIGVENGASVSIREVGNAPNDGNPANDVLFYTPAPGFTGSDTFTYELHNAQDLNGPSQTVSVTVLVTEINDPPTFIATNTNATLNITEDAGVQTLGFTNISAGPGESQQLRFEVTSNNQVLIPNANIVKNYTSPQTTGNITFQTVQNATGTAILSIQLRDAGFNNIFGDSDDALSTIRTYTVVVSAVNDAPNLTASASALNFGENGAAVQVDSTLLLSDIESNLISSASVSIGGGLAEDVLAFNANLLPGGTLPAGVAVGAFAGGAINITGNSTTANYQSILRAITYRNTSDNPSTTPRTVTFQATDTGTTNGAANPKSATATRNINVTAVNDAPVLGSTAAVNPVSVFGAPVTVAADLTLTDVDSPTLNGATVQILAGFQANFDQLTFTAEAGIEGTYNPATGVLSLAHPSGSPRASLTSYLNLLRSVQFSSTSGNPGTSRVISFTVNDGGAVNATATLQRTVNISPPNASPVLATLNLKIPVYKENSKSGKVVDNKLTLTDADDAVLAGATVRISGNFQPGDTLAFSKKKGITGTYNPATGVLTFTNTNPAAPATLKTYLSILKTVKFSNPGENNPALTRAFEFTVNDGSSTTTIVRPLNITAVNDKPDIASVSLPAVFSRQGEPVIVDAALTVTDPDSVTLNGIKATAGVGATVKISGYKQGQDFLMFDTSANITGEFNAANGTLTLRGSANATVAEFQAALRTVAYVNTSQTPTKGTRTLTFTVFDGKLKDTLKRMVTVPAPPAVQSSVGLSLAVAASGAIEWSSIGTGWNGFTLTAATITFGAGGVPQAAEIRVANAASQAFVANFNNLANNPQVAVSGNQVSGVTLEILGGSDSVTLTPVSTAEGEFVYFVGPPSEGEASDTDTSAVRQTPRRAAASPAAEDLLWAEETATILLAPSGSESAEETAPPTAAESEGEIAARRAREQAEYAAAVDALLAAACAAAG